jgi:hypothetical protein
MPSRMGAVGHPGSSIGRGAGYLEHREADASLPEKTG